MNRGHGSHLRGGAARAAASQTNRRSPWAWLRAQTDSKATS